MISQLKSCELELRREKEENRKLKERLYKADAELSDVKFQNRIMLKNNALTLDDGNQDPSAPPPYRGRTASDGSAHSSRTTDNNDDIDGIRGFDNDLSSNDSYRRAVTKRVETRVYADVHGPSSNRDVSPDDNEFTFTDSILEEIADGGK